jgi:hypothetical protein
MGMLDDGNAQALAKEMRDHPRQQGGLARAAPSRKTNHFHLVLRASSRNWGQALPSGALYRLGGNVMLTYPP